MVTSTRGRPQLGQRHHSTGPRPAPSGGATRGGRRAGPGPRPRRRPGCACWRCPTRPGRPPGDRRPSRPRAARRDGPPAPVRRPTPRPTGLPWGRRNRSCARWEGRARPPWSGRRWARPAHGGRRGRPEGCRAHPASGPGRGPAPTATHSRVGSPPVAPESSAACTRQRHSSSTRSASRSRSSAELGATVARSEGTRPLGLAGDGEDGVDEGLARRRRAENVQAAPDLGVLERAQVAVDVVDHAREVVGVGHLGHAQVAGQFGRHQQVPQLAPDGGQLGRVERLDLGVLVEQPFHPGQLVVGLGPGHGRREVVDDDGVGATLGLGALARVVDHERVQEGEVAEGGVGDAGR